MFISFDDVPVCICVGVYVQAPSENIDIDIGFSGAGVSGHWNQTLVPQKNSKPS